VIIQFSTDPDEQRQTSPAWMGAILAVHPERGLIDQAVVLVAADDEHRAMDKALNMALRYWKIADGWQGHHAVVKHLQSALTEWRGEA
jgi:hypothetical protein